MFAQSPLEGGEAPVSSRRGERLQFPWIRTASSCFTVSLMLQSPLEGRVLTGLSCLQRGSAPLFIGRWLQFSTNPGRKYMLRRIADSSGCSRIGSFHRSGDVGFFLLPVLPFSCSKGGRSSAYFSTVLTLVLNVCTLFVLSSALFIDGVVVTSIRLVLVVSVSPAVIGGVHLAGSSCR